MTVRIRHAVIEMLLIAIAVLIGASVLTPATLYGRWLDRGPTVSLDRPCAGISPATVTTLVVSPRRTVTTVPDGWSWTCRWRSTDTATLRTVNPTLEATATRWGRWGSASPTETAAKEYASMAAEQFTELGDGDTAEARAAGTGVSVLPGIGDRAQLYLNRTDLQTGYQARVVAIRGNVVVTVDLTAYRVSVARTRDVVVRAAREAVRAL